MITALLVDDEPRAVARLAQLLERSGAIDVIGTAASVDDAERFLKGRVPDVVFLDIDMPGRLGIDLVASIPAGTKVVFVTAHDGHAVDAFRQGAVDYVLEPFDEDRLAITLGRLLAVTPAPAPPPDAAASRPEPAGSVAPETVRLTFDSGRRVEIVSLDDVVWIEAVQNYTRVQTAGRQPAVVRRTLQEWGDQLGSDLGFHRLGRSLIIRLPALRSTQWQSRDQTLLFFTGVTEPLPIGRAAAARLRDLLEQRRATARPTSAGLSKDRLRRVSPRGQVRGRAAARLDRRSTICRRSRLADSSLNLPDSSRADWSRGRFVPGQSRFVTLPGFGR